MRLITTITILFILSYNFLVSNLKDEDKTKKNELTSKTKDEERRINSYERMKENAQPTPEYEMNLKNNTIIRKYNKSKIPSISTAKVPILQSILNTKFSIINMIDEIEDANPSQNESSIAINPKNPLNLISSAVDYRGNSSTWVYVSDDGGKTWINKNLGKPRPGWRSTNDPSVMFDEDGVGYLVYGGFPNTTSGENGVYLSKTLDQGKTWITHIPVMEHLGAMTLDSAFEDKYYIQVDRSSNSQYSGHLYIPWKRVIALDSATQIVVTKSIDKGQTWSTPVAVSERLAGSSEDTTFGQSFPLITNGPNGQVYLVWNHGPKKGIGFSKSLDGGQTWTEQRIIHNYKEFGTPKFLSGQGIRHTVKGMVRAEAYPVITCNYTNKSKSGELYLCWSADSIPNIYFSKSSDEGQTWSAPKIVTTVETNDQFWPWIKVDPITEDIAIMYLDSRNDPENILVECYVSYSPDGGETWIDRLADDKQSDIRNNPFTGRSFAGDYSGIDFYNGIIYPSFIDMRNTKTTNDPDSDVYTAIVNTKFPSPIENLKAIDEFKVLDKITLNWDNIFETTFGKKYDKSEAKLLIYKDNTFLKEIINLNDTAVLVDNTINAFQTYLYSVYLIRNNDTSIIRNLNVTPGGSKDLPFAKFDEFSYNSDVNSAEITLLIPAKKLDGVTPIFEPKVVNIYLNNDTTKIFANSNLTINDTNKLKTINLPFDNSQVPDNFYHISNKLISENPNYSNISLLESKLSQPIFRYLGQPYQNTYKFDDKDGKTDPPRFNSKNWGLNEFAYSPPYSISNNFSNNGTEYSSNQRDTLFIVPYFIKEKSINKIFLNFYHIALTEFGDNCNVEYSFDNGDKWKSLATYNKRSFGLWEDNELTFADWKRENLEINLENNDKDLRVVYVRFTFASNPFGQNKGWFIDDINFDLTSNKNFDDSEIVLFPNPTTEKIFINSDLNNSVNDIKVITTLGIDVTNEIEIKFYNNKTELNLEKLISGNYILLIKNNQPKLISKIK